MLPDPASVLTICNFNGELLYLYEEMKAINKEAGFIVCETRPYLQGTRLTFWELRKNNIPCKLICDNQVAALMRDGKINCIITGADRATKNGDVVNKIGTYALARLAAHYNIPFYPVTQYPKDIRVEDIKIEDRPMEEVFMFLSNEVMDEEDRTSIQAVYPSFDITVSEFVAECIELGQTSEYSYETG
jgi:methylthioribose-1-phosphate isomerase